ncbi:fumarylacetoacetate hydrolase family protein [Cupriavidus sp. L7L]|uniref:fumarylacetoacetate hydrolase family protein n=1 Tax=Cupriavidus sp. L7L TaxID=2546443 RepID=UPI0010568F80|nr:fumarylacetoacetate hydrolase family protein [Cupriavidus sp. L7L]TDF62681.1 2-hydroxyhepta-2,4-diene-1,7-dioate isomerase [Cupriavidus sp. L7L]
MGEALPLIFDDPPYRLSGVVYGTLLNSCDALGRIGDAVNQPPYKVAPQAPILYIKSRNTLSADGGQMEMAADAPALQIGATLGLVIGKTASRVSQEKALSYLAGVTLVADLSVPHDSFYRPSVRFVAQDNSCFVGPRVVPLAETGSLEEVSIQVTIDDEPATVASMSNMVRPAAQLLAAVTDFMTLQPGDILLLGVSADLPRIAKGQRFSIHADVFGRLQGAIV